MSYALDYNGNEVTDLTGLCRGGYATLCALGYTALTCDTYVYSSRDVVYSIQVRIPDTARADGWMSHDATEAVTMKKGTYVKLSTASIPLPTVSTHNNPFHPTILTL